MTAVFNKLSDNFISTVTPVSQRQNPVSRLPSSVIIGPYNITTTLPDLSSSAVCRPFVINTINAHSWVVAEQDPAFREALIASDHLLPDGEGIVWAVKYLTGKKIRKIAGYDLFLFLLEYLQKTGGSCFFLGSSEKTLDLIKARLSKEYPNIKSGFYSPPFKSEFTPDDNQQIINNIINYKLLIINSPLDVLFVGMTAPKQEKWVYENKKDLPAGIICSVGAVFDFYAGTVSRPPDWMIRLRLEWLGRLLSNPKKIWKRVFLSGPKFIGSILRTPKT